MCSSENIKQSWLVAVVLSSSEISPCIFSRQISLLHQISSGPGVHVDATVGPP